MIPLRSHGASEMACCRAGISMRGRRTGAVAGRWLGVAYPLTGFQGAEFDNALLTGRRWGGRRRGIAPRPGRMAAGGAGGSNRWRVLTTTRRPGGFAAPSRPVRAVPQSTASPACPLDPILLVLDRPYLGADLAAGRRTTSPSAGRCRGRLGCVRL